MSYNTSANQRYVLDNPFPGYMVKCVAEIKYNNKWGATGFIYATQGVNGQGTDANLLSPDDTIIVQTGSDYLMIRSIYSGSPFNNTNSVASALCRVYVEKGGLLP